MRTGVREAGVKKNFVGRNLRLEKGGSISSLQVTEERKGVSRKRDVSMLNIVVLDPGWVGRVMRNIRFPLNHGEGTDGTSKENEDGKFRRLQR